MYLFVLFFVFRAAEVWGCRCVHIWRKMHICLQPAGDRRLDRGKKGTTGQVLPARSISGPTGPGEQHHRPNTGTQGHVYLPLPG